MYDACHSSKQQPHKDCAARRLRARCLVITASNSMASPEVTLYMHPDTSSIVTEILLHQTGISFKPRLVQGKSITTDFAAINPKMQVPVLEVNGKIMTENPAIAHAINQLAPEKQIMGNSPT